jgi:hypothetical protein
MFKQRWRVASALRVVIALVVASCVASVVILAVPVAHLTDREQLSQAVSTIFALVTGIIAIILTARLASSDHAAEEQVKADIAKLLAALRSILVKGAVKDRVDLAHERQQVNEFMSSTTAFALWSWVGFRSREAGEAPEEWRTFFLMLVDVLGVEDTNPRAVMGRVVAIERLFTGLSDDDVNRISRFVSDLAGAVGDFDESRESDPLLKAMHEIYGEAPNRQDVVRAKLLHIKAKGVQDPDLDLFLAVSSKKSPESLASAKRAVDAGADLSVTDEELLARHADKLVDFVEG